MEKECILITILLLASIYLYTLINNNEYFNCNRRPQILDSWKKMIPFWNRPVNKDYYKLLDTSIVTTYGTPNPLRATEMLLENDKNIVSVDGTNKSPKSLAVFSYNKSSPECCQFGNGGFSTDRGCVCVTPEQQRWFQNVGGNRQNGYDGF
jgi:hypothetical protein